jgi:hypothetical protein
MHVQVKYFDHAVELGTSISTVPTERKLTPVQTQRETQGSLLGFALRSLSKILRSLWVRSTFATGSLWVHYLCALYALMREADLTFILPPVSPAPCIFQTFTR